MSDSPSSVWQQVRVDKNVQFRVPHQWTFIRRLGAGSYGTVASFCDNHDRKFAVKRVGSAFQDALEAQRTLREVKLLRRLKHVNILGLLDVLPQTHSDVYLITELMDFDLHQLIYKGKQQLSDMQHESIIYQLMRGVLALDTAQVLHRDIKPSNIFLNSQGVLKIGDLGLARGGMGDIGSNMTEYVVTRQYRCPELLLGTGTYTSAVDVWSCGVVIAELLIRQSPFPGRNSMDQISQIFNTLGKPDAEELPQWLDGAHHHAARNFVRKFVADPNKPRLRELFYKTNQTSRHEVISEDAIVLIEAMLQYNPVKRPRAAEALKFGYFKRTFDLRDPDLDGARDMAEICWDFDPNPDENMSKEENKVMCKQIQDEVKKEVAAMEHPYIPCEVLAACGIAKRASIPSVDGQDSARSHIRASIPSVDGQDSARSHIRRVDSTGPRSSARDARASNRSDSARGASARRGISPAAAAARVFHPDSRPPRRPSTSVAQRVGSAGGSRRPSVEVPQGVGRVRSIAARPERSGDVPCVRPGSEYHQADTSALRRSSEDQGRFGLYSGRGESEVGREYIARWVTNTPPDLENLQRQASNPMLADACQQGASAIASA
eukprot:CAMPEP_0204272764 /NCGR_PEP_ID=MMETSP0468-20130131/22267_1 /ASSEMBLY_ACC=CAM_ASM_000383 /TAXON_ID=2969 /ORGANISM="Oxyrrhis marina" /LENGTH=604 /DNA_ID=CAMNT_0051248645 /DNA_START=38 /DNA_END=1853 /DNA_ORIENTATION=+